MTSKDLEFKEVISSRKKGLSVGMLGHWSYQTSVHLSNVGRLVLHMETRGLCAKQLKKLLSATPGASKPQSGTDGEIEDRNSRICYFFSSL